MLPTPPRLLACTILILGLQWPGANGALAQQAGLWDLVQHGGYVLLIRHAGTPLTKTAMPSSRGGCVLDRDLTDAGQILAQRLGVVFREHGVPVARVLSSPGCPSIETAQIAFGRVEPWTDPDPAGDPRVWRARSANALTTQIPVNANIVVVTDKIIISNLTDHTVSAGDVLVLKPSGEQLDVQGLLAAP